MATKKSKKTAQPRRAASVPTRIVLHHGTSSDGMHYTIARNGTVTNVQTMCASSLHILLESHGRLTQDRDGRFHPADNPAGETVTYFYEYCRKNRWHGACYYEMYTTRQLEALRQLLRELCEQHGISKTYNAKRWYPTAEAADGTGGIFFHCSFDAAADDPHPQQELINVLKTL